MPAKIEKSEFESKESLLQLSLRSAPGWSSLVYCEIYQPCAWRTWQERIISDLFQGCTMLAYVNFRFQLTICLWRASSGSLRGRHSPGSLQDIESGFLVEAGWEGELLGRALVGVLVYRINCLWSCYYIRIIKSGPLIEIQESIRCSSNRFMGSSMRLTFWIQENMWNFIWISGNFFYTFCIKLSYFVPPLTHPLSLALASLEFHAH